MAADVPSLCPLCNAPNPQQTGRTQRDSGITYTQCGCAACGVEFWWPLKNPGAEWYRSQGYDERNADPIWSATTNHKRTLSLLRAYRGAVLDVGCGIGNFLSAAKERGWQCTGIDFDPDAIAAAKRVTSIADLHVADIISFAQKNPNKKFDLITFFDVLEHIDNHNEFIASVASLLKPRGLIAMSMPYRHHALWLMKGDVPPRHLTCWDVPSLKAFLQSRGFDIVCMRRNPAELWTIVMKLRFKYGARVSFGAVSAVRRSLCGAEERDGGRPLMVRIVHALAQAKDAIIFGLPASVIWLAMIPTRKRYDDLYAIARKRG